MRFLIFLGAVLMLVAPARAQNNFAHGVTIEEVLAMIAAEGFAGEIVDADAHAAVVDIGETQFAVDAFNCSADGRCTEFLFSIGYDLEAGFPLAKINDWNASMLGGRAYLDDENDPWVDHSFSLNSPSDKAVFQETFEFWLSIIVTFEDYIFGKDEPLS